MATNNNSNAKKIFELSEEIIKHKRLYYLGRPEISDSKFDALEDQLRKLDDSHPVLQMVGMEIGSSKNEKVAHDLPMLSLGKTYSKEDLNKWIDNKPVVGTFKVDGNSLSLIYKKGKLVEAKTRGNGKIGELVTDKIKWVAECVNRLKEPIDCEVRGELYCDEIKFAAIHHEMIRLGLEEPTNPRNIVAGILGRKKHIDLARFFGFFAFEAIGNELSDIKTELEKMEWLENQGFQLPMHQLIENQSKLESFMVKAQKHIEEGTYGIDGVVYTFNDLSLHEKLGSTSHHPRFKLSFKWQGELATTKIHKIHWATSRLGIVTPVAVVEPVYLSGANITNVTLHNALMVKELNLKPDDEIEIIRSGEVIPKLERVVSQAKGESEFPSVCPSCGTDLEFDDVRLLCPNQKTCPAQFSGQILNWIKSSEIEDISEKRLQLMIDEELVQHASDLYKLQVKDFLRLPSTKEKMANKLFNNIQSKRQLLLVQFLNGLGISGMGSNSWTLLTEQYSTLEKVMALKVEDISEIDGFAEKTASSIVEGLQEKSQDIKRLLDAGVEIITNEVSTVDRDSLVFNGQIFVITGTLTRPRSEIAKEIQKLGGKVTGSVSKNTSALITNDPDSGSSKAKKAIQLSIPIWSEEELFKKISNV